MYEVNADSVPFDTVDEESQFPDVATPVLKKVEYVIKKFGGILKATYELLEDSDENIIHDKAKRSCEIRTEILD